MKSAGIPNVTGVMAQRKSSETTTTGKGAITAVLGCFDYEDNFVAKSPSARLVCAESNNTIDRVHFDASKSNSIYGSSNTVQPPSIIIIPQIRC